MAKASKSEIDYSRGHAGAHCGKVLDDDKAYRRYFIPPLSPGNNLGQCRLVSGRSTKFIVQVAAAGGKAVAMMAGTVTDIDRGSVRVALDNGQLVRATLAGRLLKHRIRVMAGEKVQVEMTPYDLTKGRITYRFK